MLQAERNFQLPLRRRSRWWLWPLAAALHVPLLFIVLRKAAPLRDVSPMMRAIVIPDAGRAVTMRYRPGHRAVIAPLRPTAAALTRFPAQQTEAPHAPTPPMSASPATIEALPLVVDTQPHSSPRTVAPRYGNGRLWVQPMVAAPREIASALTGKSPAQIADSAVTAMVQAYLDQMAKERPAYTEALPSWTTKIAGKTVGIDQRWIYLGPLKVPTALLALLPIKIQANPTQAEFNARLQEMRADLFEAGRRAQNYEDFKAAVKDLRQQKEREREFKKNQRTPPDTGTHG